jgi:RNA-directed DNA polymerase
MSTEYRRARLRANGQPTWRFIRYADDFTILVNGTEEDTRALQEVVADVLTGLGLHLSDEKTRIVHMSEGYDFLGRRIQWRRKPGTTKWYVYTFIAPGRSGR